MELQPLCLSSKHVSRLPDFIYSSTVSFMYTLYVDHNSTPHSFPTASEFPPVLLPPPPISSLLFNNLESPVSVSAYALL